MTTPTYPVPPARSFGEMLRPASGGARLTPAAAQSVVDAAGNLPLSPALAAAVEEANAAERERTAREIYGRAFPFAQTIKAAADHPDSKVVYSSAFGESESVAAASIPVAPVPTEPMEQLAVVTGHNDGRLSMLLTGTVGRVGESGFSIDPAYEHIDDMFASLTRQPLPFAEFSLSVVDVPVRDVSAFRDNMMRVAQPRWEQVATQMSGHLNASSVMATALRNQVARSLADLKRHVEAQGYVDFDVPVTASFVVPQHGPVQQDTDNDFRMTHAALAAEGALVEGSTQLDPSRRAARTSDRAQPIEQLVEPELRDHAGPIDLTVKSSVQLVAQDASQASRIAKNFLPIVERSMGNLQKVLTFGPASIENAVMRPYEAPFDTEQDDDDWMDRDHG